MMIIVKHYFLLTHLRIHQSVGASCCHLRWPVHAETWEFNVADALPFLLVIRLRFVQSH